MAGHSNSEIAAHLVVAVSTVKTHIKRIFGKLAVESRTQAIVRARELGLLGLFLTFVLCSDPSFSGFDASVVAQYLG